MRLILPTLVSAVVLVVLAPAASPLLRAAVEGQTALAAVKLIPRDKAANLARIEARGGTPEPDRWYLIVHAPEDENGLREFVIANNEIVASRPVSQFTESIKSRDVIGRVAVKIDSDRVAKLARQYAQANNLAISTMNYELKKDGEHATPVWKVSCLDENGRRVGELRVTAGKGNVVSHDGFAVKPQVAQKKKPTPRFDVYAESQVAPVPRAIPAARTDTGDADEFGETEELGPPSEEEQNTSPRENRRRARSREDRRGNPVEDAARSVGRTIRRILPF